MRGLGSLPSREIGQLMRRSWLIADSAVIRDRICATPVCPPRFFCPQLPVEKAYFRPEVIFFCTTASPKLAVPIVPFSIILPCTALTLLRKERHSWRKSRPIITPDESTRLIW